MDATTPLVSVIMSVYNGEQWLQQAIDSILQQSYTHLEFIIIDDASNQPTKDILAAIKDPRVIILYNDEQQGLTKNLNKALAHCKGKYIARMDADDISLPDRLEKQVEFLEANATTQVLAGFIEMIDENNLITGVWKDDRNTTGWKLIKKTLPWKSCIAHPTVMFRKEIINHYAYNERQSHSQDWDLWLRLANDSRIIEKLNEPILLYRVHKKSTTKISNRKSAFSKKKEFYKRYFADERKGWFNFKVRIGCIFNSVKLFLSRIKRSILS